MVFTRKDGIFMGYVSFREGRMGVLEPVSFSQKCSCWILKMTPRHFFEGVQNRILRVTTSLKKKGNDLGFVLR